MSAQAQALPLPLDELPASVVLATRHYLGATVRGTPYVDEYGVMLFGPPTARFLPAHHWLELKRWCLRGEANDGSRQWAKAWRWLRERFPEVTTVVSYSDPSVGHTGALYRACNWLWAPTWMRLRPPPSGGGSWDGIQPPGAVKDRWVWPLAPDSGRAGLLAIHDEGLRRRYPWAEYREPRFRRDTPVIGSGGGDYARFIMERLP